MKKIYKHYSDEMCNFKIFLVGSVPLDFFNVKKVTMAQKLLRNTSLISIAVDFINGSINQFSDNHEHYRGP